MVVVGVVVALVVALVVWVVVGDDVIVVVGDAVGVVVGVVVCVVVALVVCVVVGDVVAVVLVQPTNVPSTDSTKALLMSATSSVHRALLTPGTCKYSPLSHVMCLGTAPVVEGPLYSAMRSLKAPAVASHFAFSSALSRLITGLIVWHCSSPA